ncbi:TraR/DksA C4-type zinc finger protein [Xanthobacter sp. KR7-225]|uniref:TraR/DksA C4-type zinc finger protein n=1 Tax=Xanthobacter sp. KR7-225 TaxID=3156613 RepID=UPI0032B5639A
MSDEADLAQSIDERHRGAAIAHVRAQVEVPGTDDCEACGAPISPARRAALPSATRCIGCQERFERRRR